MPIVNGVTVLALLALACPASAQSAPTQAQARSAVVIGSGPVFALPDEGRTPLKVLTDGMALRVLSVEGTWLRVEFQDPQFGARVGYIRSKFIREQNQPTPLPAMDLSVPMSQPVASTPPGSPAQQPDRPARRRQPREARSDRGWIDIDVARLQSRQGVETFTFTKPLYQETLAASTSYPSLPAVTDLFPAGGVGIGNGLSIGMRFDAQNYKSTVGLGIAVPSPYFFNTLGVDGAVTASALERRERALDIIIQYSVPTSDRVSVRLFGGPTYFHVTNDMVGTIIYNQVVSSLAPVNIVGITGFNHNEVSGSSFGINVGLDVAVFFTSRVGVGGVIRLSRGTVTIQDPLTGRDGELKVGHTALGGGLRLRF